MTSSVYGHETLIAESSDGVAALVNNHGERLIPRDVAQRVGLFVYRDQRQPMSDLCCTCTGELECAARDGVGDVQQTSGEQ